MESLDRLRPAFDAVPTPMMVVDAGGLVQLANEHLETLFGYESGELVGKPIEQLIPEEARSHHPELREAFFEAPDTRRMGTGRDLFGVRKDGLRIPVEIGLNPMETQQGLMVLASVLDITERKRHEERFRLAVDAAATGMIMVNRAGLITMVNDQACDMFGYERVDLVGRSIECLIPTRFQRRHTVFRASFIQSPLKRPMGRDRALFALHRSGSEIPVEIGLTPIEAADGPVMMTTIIDVTKHREDEAEIRRKNDELTRLNAELVQFTYSASHDLKSPLTSIAGLARAIIEDVDDADLTDVRPNAVRIDRLANSLATLVEEILDLAKADHLDDVSKIPALDEHFAAVVERWEPIAKQSGVRIEATLPSVSIVSHPTRLTQILENLLSNGIRYAEPNRADRFVRIEARCPDGGVDLTVEDNGVGIPAQHHDEVFRMFRRFHPTAADGHGLGLALVSKHVQQLGGTITFESSSEGTRFHVQLPPVVL